MAFPFRLGAIVPFLLAALGLAPPGVAVHVDDESDAPLQGAPGECVVVTTAVLAEAENSVAVGPYRPLAELGVGGMGVVHVAEATGAARRRVALKRIRGPVLSAVQLTQFTVEVQALAALEHEHIVRFYDAGTTEDGAPWFAMELVDGEPITDYCARRALGIDARLALVADVARAVEHMHTRGVVHGDLKPNNILVTERDGRPIVKVIDLGSARLSGHENLTPYALMGTLAYMAPELLDHALTSDDPDSAVGLPAQPARALRRAGERSDVYALGLVLRELLFGSERNELAGEGWLALALDRATRPLPAPSAVLRTRAARARRDARPVTLARGVVDRTLARRLARGLEAVLQQATEMDPRRRTSSAGALAASLERDVERAVRTSARCRRAGELCASAVAGGLAGWLLG